MWCAKAGAGTAIKRHRVLAEPAFQLSVTSGGCIQNVAGGLSQLHFLIGRTGALLIAFPSGISTASHAMVFTLLASLSGTALGRRCSLVWCWLFLPESPRRLEVLGRIRAPVSLARTSRLPFQDYPRPTHSKLGPLSAGPKQLPGTPESSATALIGA